MQSVRFFLFCVLPLPFFALSQGLSGNERMDIEVRSVIMELKMTENVKSKFIEIYKRYGNVMKKAKQSGVNRWSLYMIFIKASRERDSQMNEILDAQQYDFYLERQKKIDKMASGL